MTHKPLLSIKVVSKAVSEILGPVPDDHLSIIKDWQEKTKFGSSETNLDGSFITGFLCPLLGYAESNATGKWTIQKNTAIAGTGNVDVGIGHFTSDGKASLVAPFELKGPKTKDLDAIMPGRHKTPVQQAWEYAMDTKGAQWVLVSNMTEIRLYAVGYGRQAYEIFKLNELHQPKDYARFKLLLGAPALLGGGAASLLKLSETADKDITNRLYRDYKALRSNLIQGLQKHNVSLSVEDAIQYAQTILDRVLFIAFAEDTRLLPQRSLADAFEVKDDYSEATIWERFVKLFSWVDKGFPKRNIPPYNGGLFRQDEAIDALTVPDKLCEGFKKLGEYDFASEISVNILGHIFEQSITDLEEIKAQLENAEYDTKQGKRKKDGVFYTPDFITRYIVEQAVGGWLDERRTEFGFYDLPELDPEKDYPNLIMGKKKQSTGKVSLTPNAKKHLAYWQAYKTALASIKVLDPACGSGAFLVQTFDYLLEEGQRVNAEIARLQGGIEDILERLDTSILKNNLFGVDLNPESVEITKLSLWLKTASSREKLTYLDDNIKCGNSIVGDSKFAGAAALNWHDSFKSIFAAGGFDVVVGNPPYVRSELFSKDKPYLQENYTTYDGAADLYVYFYEKGVDLLKAGGLLGYISNSTFFKTGYGVTLRTYLSQHVSLKRLVDFGDRQVFEGATTYPAIVILKKVVPAAGSKIAFTKVTDAKVNFATLEAQAATMLQTNLGQTSWHLESVSSATLRKKIVGDHKTLLEQYSHPLYGIKTGLNSAFIIGQTKRDQLVKADPSVAAVIKPFLEGKDLQKWHTENRDLHLILFEKGWTKQNSGLTDETAAWNWLQQKHPGVTSHLATFAEKAKTRGDKGDFWWELRACAYYPQFDTPKVIYPDIAADNQFSLDTKSCVFTNTAYMVPNADWFLLAVLNSKVSWFFWSGQSAILRGGFLRFFSQNVEPTPIPHASETQRADLGKLAEQCQQAAEARYKAQQDVVKRIPDLALNPTTAKLTTKLQAWWEMDFVAFQTEVKKAFKQGIPVSERSQWQTFLEEHRKLIEALSAKISNYEGEINKQVYALFNLSADEIAVIEGQ